MSRPLCLAALAAVLAAALASAQEAPKKDGPRPWEEIACDPSGRGLLVRAHGDAAAGALEQAAGDEPGFDEVGEDDDSGDAGGAQDGQDKPKPKKRHKKRARKTSTYTVAPGEGCAQRLTKLRGARLGEKGSLADELEVTAAPEELPKTEAGLDKYFKGAGTLGKLSRMSFKTPGDLTKLFDKAQKLGSFEGARKQALAGGGAFDAGPESGGVLADTRPKPDPSGTAYEKPDQLRKVARQQAPPVLFEPERDEAEPPRVYSRYAPVRAAQRAYDWSAEAASNIADNTRFTYDKLRGNAPVQQVGPLTVVGGWAKLPSSGPGFSFVGHGQYGTPTLVSGLMAAAADPLVNIAGAKPMQVVAISKYGGGHFPPHITHQQGIDVDVALSGFRNGPLAADALDRNLLFAVSVVEHMKPTYILLDQRRQYELQARANALLNQADMDESVKARVRAAYPLLFTRTPPPRGKKLFSHVENHYDHFHIRETTGEIGK